MNIHEYQAKVILKNFGIPVPEGVVLLNNLEIEKKSFQIKIKKFSCKSTNSCRRQRKSRRNKTSQ